MQIHILGTHETLTKYISQMRDANLRHSGWLKSASPGTQNKLVNSWHICAVLIFISQSIPSVNTPTHDYVLTLNCLGNL